MKRRSADAWGSGLGSEAVERLKPRASRACRRVLGQHYFCLVLALTKMVRAFELSGLGVIASIAVRL